jgi:hypothetical protein
MVIEKKFCKKCNTEKDATYYDTSQDAPAASFFVIKSNGGSSIRISKLLVLFGIRQLVEFAYKCETCKTITARCPRCDGYNVYFYDEKQKCEKCKKDYYNFCA